MRPLVTVVVATRDRRHVLGRTLAKLHALAERPPVIVVDDASADGTADAVREQFPWARVVALAAPAGPAARNIGVRLAGTPFVAFADDDSWYAEGALAAACRVLATRPRLGLIAARVLVGPEETIDPTCVAMESGELRGFLACGAVVSRDAFLGAGGFHRWMSVGGEEAYVAEALRRSGWWLEYRPEVVAHHWPPGRTATAPRRRDLARNAALTSFLLRPRSAAVVEIARRLVRHPAPSAIAGTLEGAAAAAWLAAGTERSETMPSSQSGASAATSPPATIAGAGPTAPASAPPASEPNGTVLSAIVRMTAFIRPWRSRGVIA
jgi:hypothetical protein